LKKKTSKSSDIPVVKEKLTRNNRKTILFNQKEVEVINSFCKKYNIKSQTKFCREAIISTILQRLDEDHPKLF
jgi:hypothetical protein